MPEYTLLAILSVIATGFAAMAAFLSYKTQRDSFNHSAKPDIIINLDSFSRGTDSVLKADVITFSEIENIGNGTAQNIHIRSIGHADDSRPTHHMQNTHFPVLAKGETIKFDAKIYIHWKHIPLPENDHKLKFLSIKIKVIFRDTVGMFHTTIYTLIVFEDAGAHLTSDVVTAGVGFCSIESPKSIPVWRLNLKKKFNSWFNRIARRKA